MTAYLVDVHGALIPEWWCIQAQTYAARALNLPETVRPSVAIRELPEAHREWAWMERHRLGAKYATTLPPDAPDRDAVADAVDALRGLPVAFYTGGVQAFVREEALHWIPERDHEWFLGRPFIGRTRYTEPDKPDPYILLRARATLTGADEGVLAFDDEPQDAHGITWVETHGPAQLLEHLAVPA